MNNSAANISRVLTWLHLHLDLLHFLTNSYSPSLVSCHSAQLYSHEFKHDRSCVLTPRNTTASSLRTNSDLSILVTSHLINEHNCNLLQRFHCTKLQSRELQHYFNGLRNENCALLLSEELETTGTALNWKSTCHTTCLLKENSTKHVYSNWASPASIPCDLLYLPCLVVT